MSVVPLPVRERAGYEGASDGAVTLVELVAALGPDLLSVVAAPFGLDEPVSDPVIHDSEAPALLRPGDIVLAVGVAAASQTAVELARQAGRAQAAAVVFKVAGAVPVQLIDAAAAGAVAVLAIPVEADWGNVHALLRSATASSARLSSSPAMGELAIGDLFGLANAVAAMVGGGVVIHDNRLRLLAYSVQDGETDEVRRATILARRAPEHVVEMVRRAGVLRQLREPGHVVDLSGPDYSDMQRRLAIGVHAGDEQLGSIWVLEQGRVLDSQAMAALREAAQMAALHLVRHMAHDDIVRRHRSVVLQEFFDGRLPAAIAADTLDMPMSAEYVLIAVRLPEGSEAGRDLHAERLLSLITAYSSTYRIKTVQMAVGEAVYVLVTGGRGDVRDAARRLADYMISAADRSWSLPIRVATSEPVQQLGDAPELRRVIDQVLRVATELNRPLPDVVTLDDVQAACIIDDLRALALDRSRWAPTKLRRLVAQDRARDLGYVEILRAYLDSGGNMRAAAGLLGIHPNTYRYRFQRVAALIGSDLDNPDERLVLALQLRLGLLPEQSKDGHVWNP